MSRINYLSLKNRIFEPPNYKRKDLDEELEKIKQMIEDEI